MKPVFIMKAIGLTTTFLIAIVLGSIFSGYTLSVLWGWFISPTFGLVKISIPVAIGIVLIIFYMTQQTSQCEKEDEELSDTLIELIVTSIAKPMFALFWGWIVTLFL